MILKTMNRGHEAALGSGVESIEKVLHHRLLLMQQEQPERRFVVEVADGENLISIPRPELETVFKLLLEQSNLFQTNGFMVLGDRSKARRYQLRFISLDSGLSDVQSYALKHYRSSIVGCFNNQLLAVIKARLIVESFYGQLHLDVDEKQRLNVNMTFCLATGNSGVDQVAC